MTDYVWNFGYILNEAARQELKERFIYFVFTSKIKKIKPVREVSAVQLETSTSHQPLPFKGAPTVNVSRRFLTDRKKMLHTAHDSFNIIYIC